VPVSLPDWEQGWVWVHVPIPPAAISGEFLEVSFESPVWSPAELGTSGDTRSLSFFLRDVRVIMDEMISQ